MGITRDIVIGGSCAALMGAAFVFAGPLNPPAGPVSPTGTTLDELSVQIDGIDLTTTPEPLSAIEFVQQNSVPGDAHDGRPAMLGNPRTGPGFGGVEVEIATIGTFRFTTADIGIASEPIFQQGPGGSMTLIPGAVTYDITLTRPLDASVSTALHAWQTQALQTGVTRNGTIRLYDANNQLTRLFIVSSCYPAVFDVRSVNNEIVEQVTIAATLVEVDTSVPSAR